jgi:predicted O-linked N-acetylglucosamine transferase (SPINDLY family)
LTFENVSQAHNRAQVKVYAYATSPDDGSSIRARIRNESHVFRDLHDLRYALVSKETYNESKETYNDSKETYSESTET